MRDSARVCDRAGHVGHYQRDSSGAWRCTECRRELARARRNANLEVERARVRDYWRQNPDKVKEMIARRDPETYGKAWIAANPERVAALRHAWYERNSFKQKQKARLRQAQYEQGDLTADEWSQLIDACDNRCLSCGRDDEPLSVDHIVPMVEGGRHTLGNVQPLCLDCNKRKFTKTIDYRPAEIVAWVQLIAC